MDKQQFLISRLADGEFHSGETLAAELGISRTAIWKRVRNLADVGLDVYSVKGKGYRLSQPIEILDADTIRANMSAAAIAKFSELQVTPVIDSTNLFLNQLLNQQSIHSHIVLAEYQNQGKGRRGNEWISPYGSGLCMSLGWHFESTPASYTALSLATGVAVCRGLRRLGITNAGLKWPNDIISDGRKLGGVLLESRGETAGISDVIIGIGLNVNLHDSKLGSIDQPVTDINRITRRAISRNDLAGVLIEELLLMLEDYQENGFAPCLQEWREFDALKGKQGNIMLANETLSGEVLGINENGQLLMSVNGETRSFNSGELSLRVNV